MPVARRRARLSRVDDSTPSDRTVGFLFLMKKLIPALFALSSVAAFAAEPASSAAVAEPVVKAPRQRVFYADAGLAVSDVSVVPVVAGVKGSRDSESFGGVNLGFGSNFGESSLGYHQVGVNLTATGRFEEQGSTDVSMWASSLMFQYNYHFRPAKSVTLYVGPSVGFLSIGRWEESGSGDVDDSDSSFAFGGQAGVAIRCSDLVWVNFGYRGLVAGDMNLNQFATKYEDIRVHTFHCGVTFRF